MAKECESAAVAGLVHTGWTFMEQEIRETLKPFENE
jgi:hypothetical protein